MVRGLYGPESGRRSNYRLLHMGPVRTSDESNSEYRLRYASYCFKWLCSLGLPFVVMLLVRPSLDVPPAMFIVFFLYIGLGLGTGCAFLAMVGFAIGGFWAGWLENSASRPLVWTKLKNVTGVILLMFFTAFFCYWFVKGLVTGETLAFSKKFTIVQFSGQKQYFLLSMSAWFLFTVATLRAVLKAVRNR